MSNDITLIKVCQVWVNILKYQYDRVVGRGCIM